MHGAIERRIKMSRALALIMLMSVGRLASGQSRSNGGRVTFVESSSEERSNRQEEAAPPGPEGRRPDAARAGLANGTRQGKDLFDWIGLGTGQNVDPYLSKTNRACLEGDLAECFKSRALQSFSEFFDRPTYSLNENVRVIRMSSDIVQNVIQSPYEYSGAPRAEETEWEQLVKFAARKAERFVKTVAFEVSVPKWVAGENEIYAPRFLDEIVDEIDTIENKKDTLFSRNRLKKLLIPMLVVLKLFKLKLLLFLPLILGLASFKKFLAFLAIVIPGLIGFFKLCKPQIQNYQPPIYSQSGLGFPHYKENGNTFVGDHGGYREEDYHQGYTQGDRVSFGQDLAYSGYREYGS
ncbi:uncharacterized protein LOC107263192 [Cephus cinctus]|uniref:Uncharacterized protein LOC107263192 n=1 Tax=Cephus cinctus TaxID=211228 RepID=A0AAJ7FCY2_CEPCN|nr:uncharacterized protein LOC107263192 [Cephus cinctus]